MGGFCFFFVSGLAQAPRAFVAGSLFGRCVGESGLALSGWDVPPCTTVTVLNTDSSTPHYDPY